MTETCWEVLGIEAINDERAIKKAYAQKLKHNKPDKNPEGFRALREAYEQALSERFWLDIYVDEDSKLAFYDEEIPASSEPKDSFTSPSQSSFDDLAIDDSSAINELLSECDVSLFTQAESFPSAINKLDLWQDEWLDSIVDKSKPLSNEEEVNFETNIHGYALKSDHDKADKLLFKQLEQQFDQLENCSLDDIDDYERALIVFFEGYPKAYSDSYFFAKSHFDWQQYVDGWDNSEYPWLLLRNIDESYIKISHFDTKNNFLKYIASKYPMLYQQWDLDLPELVVPRKWQFIRSFFWPHIAYEVKQQLNNLKQELAHYTHTEFDPDTNAHMQYWLNHPQLKVLDKRLGIFGVINLIDFILIGLICWVLFQFLGSVVGYQAALDDGIQSWLTISLFYIYWQIQLNIFTHSKIDLDFVPDNFFLVLQAISLLVIFSLAMEAFQNPSLTDGYDALHLFSFIFVLIWALRQGNIITKVLMVLNATLLFVLVATTGTENTNPAVWLWFSIPIIVHLLKIKTRLSMLYISEKILSALIGAPLIILYLLATKTVPLFFNQGLIVSSLLLIVGVMLIIGMAYKAINNFKTDEMP